ncbi:MAG: hypothetical protein EWM47_04525 [Anaerolineaceae bacterium]|nr:MAG: hypothetical protein EWM47_04525 [Anaerolineaceae bacterium]
MKRLFSILLCILLFITGAFGSFTGSYMLFSTPETSFDSSYLMKFDDENSSYYLQKAPQDISFFIESDSNEYHSLFTITDFEGSEISCPIERSGTNQFRVLSPTTGYSPGKQYTLTLHNDATFSGSELKDVKELVFSIEKEAIETYTYHDEVKNLSKVEMQVYDEDIVKVEDISLQIGDIFINESGHEAYKVVDILEDGSLKVETPAYDEIFSDLQMYGEYTWDVDQIEWNDDLENEIIENIRNSNFFDSLIMVAYAADDEPKKVAGVSVDYTKNKEDNTIELEIEINLAPGSKGLFGISKLKNQEVTITLETAVGFKINANVDGPVWNPSFDISATESNEFSWTVGFGFYSEDIIDRDIDPNQFINNLSKYQNIVGDLTKKLASITKDKESGEIKLCNWTMPIPAIPLLSFEAEVVLFAELEVAADLTLGGHSSTRYTSGIHFKDYKFRTYSDEYKTKSKPTLSLIGNADFKMGVKLKIGFKVISKKVAYVGIDPQAGVYAELFLTYPLLKPEEMSNAGSILGLYGYFEKGIYFSADIKAWVNLVFDKLEFDYKLIEKKAPIITLGNDKIAIQISSSRNNIRALNNSFTAPNIIFEYYDVTKGRISTEVLKTEDVKFTVNNNELEKNGKEIKLPVGEGTSFYVTASYKNQGDNKTYSTLFKVIVSGSEIEGRVSEYTSGTNYNPIPNATVRLFSANDTSNALSSTVTDTEGKFLFNVGEGKYILKITAAGYKELTSVQEISKNETKFTEHILLVDNAQIGNGMAGGYINNAIDGRNLEGVELRLRENWNNRTGEYYLDYNIRTDSNGQYRIENIPVGYYTIEAFKDDFYTDYCNIIVHSTDPQLNQNFTISPILPENQLRIVLRWGETPRDLDSHLIGNKPDGNGFNVFYSNMRYVWNDKEMAYLDVDDTTSYGPETITIFEPINGWVYAVHDFSNRSNTDSENMSYSGAYVTVFTGGKQVATFNIPVGEVGTYWTVFEYVDGQIRPINVVNNIAPTP